MTIMSGNDVRDDLRWQHFLRADPSFFRPIYTSYNLENCYFQAVLMLMKTTQVICVLGPEANTVTQLALVTCSQCAFAAFFAVKIPYRLAICNVIMMTAEVFVMGIVGLSLVFLLNSDDGQWELGFGVAICALGIILLLVQIRTSCSGTTPPRPTLTMRSTGCSTKKMTMLTMSRTEWLSKRNSTPDELKTQERTKQKPCAGSKLHSC